MIILNRFNGIKNESDEVLVNKTAIQFIESNHEDDHKTSIVHFQHTGGDLREYKIRVTESIEDLRQIFHKD